MSESVAWDGYYDVEPEPVDEIAVDVARDYCETCGKFTDGDACPACGEEGS